MLPDTPEPDEEGEPLETLATPETVDNTKLQELAENNKKLFARAKKAEDKLKALKDKPVAEPAATPAAPLDELDAVLELQSKGFSPNEVREAKAFAKRTGQTLNAVASDKYFTAGIEADRAKQSVEQATPAPSSRTLSVGNKTWAEMTPDERKANFGKVMEGAARGGNSNI